MRISPFLAPLFLGALPVALARDAVNVPEDYQSWSACEKQEWLWNHIEQSEYRELPQWGIFNPLALLFENLNVTMDRESDVMPAGRPKAIHTYGSVAQVGFVSNGRSPFSGILASGAECALIRLSLAASPDLVGVLPGVSLKFLVSGQPSVNTMLLRSLDGQGKDYDFFRYPVSNILPEPRNPALQALKLVFARGSRHPLRLGLDRFSRVDEKGNFVSQPSAAYEMILEPTARVQFAAEPRRLVQEDFATLPAGTAIYRVLARDSERGAAVDIGFLETRSRFVASRFGDDTLFFQHQRFRGE